MSKIKNPLTFFTCIYLLNKKQTMMKKMNFKTIPIFEIHSIWFKFIKTFFVDFEPINS